MQTLLMKVARGVCAAALGSFLLCAGAQTPENAAAPVVHPAFPSGASTPLGEQVAALLADPSVSRAHFGIAVTAMDGTPLYGLDEGKLFRPASNAKLFTTAAAMALIGPDATVTTKIVGELDAHGTVKGDLTIVGAGDANLASDDLPYVPPAQRPKGPQAAQQPVGLDDLRAMADQLVAKGVKRVTGRVVGDDTLFVHEPFAGSWDVGDLVWGYGAPVSALTIADNELKLTVTPGTLPGAPGGKPGVAPTVTLEQNGVPYYTVESQVEVTPAGTGSHVDVQRDPGSRVLRVYGSMAVDARPDVEHVSIDDPALYVAMALKQMLVERGIRVGGEATVLHREVQDGRGFLGRVDAPLTDCETAEVNGAAACALDCLVHPAPRGAVLASHTSAPLAEDVKLTLKVSQNLHAEMLLRRVGRASPCAPESTAQGAHMRRAFLLKAGLDPGDFVFYDGSGLSGHDLVTPRATAQLLAYAAKQSWFAQWKAALPVGGEDGTLASRFSEPPLKDHLFAKTGTLGESRGLSGYLDAASGKQVIFSIFVDDHSPVSSADRKVMDEIVAAIAADE